MPKLNPYPKVRPATDIVDTENGVQIRANMPGVMEKDLCFCMQGNTLHISASSRCPVPEESKDVRTLEFGNVEFFLDISMEGILSAPPQASLDNGVLSVLLPHRTEGGGQVTLL